MKCAINVDVVRYRYKITVLGLIHGKPKSFYISKVDLVRYLVNFVIISGLNSNSAVLRNEVDTKLFLTGVLATQPQMDPEQVQERMRDRHREIVRDRYREIYRER